MNPFDPSALSDDELSKKINDSPAMRRMLTSQSLLAFWSAYCIPHMQKQYGVARFQKEIMAILQDPSIRLYVLEGARGSSKTSIANYAFAVWSVTGAPQKKYVVIIARTQELARQHLANIKSMMVTYPLASDMGPFKIPADGQWSQNAIDIPKYGARIVALSIDQSLRGLLHRNVRPQVIICDDMEDSLSVRGSDNRDRLYRVFSSDVVPLKTDDSPRIVVIGTRLHHDSLIMRLKGEIESGTRAGLFSSYPIVDAEGNILWPEKYPTMADIEAKRKEIGDPVTWSQEFLLRVVSDTSRVIRHESIKYYDQLPPETSDAWHLVSIDPAAVAEDGNDFTAIVCARVHGYGDKAQIYVLPNPINAHLGYEEILKAVHELGAVFGKRTHVIIEGNGFQNIYETQLKREGFHSVTSIKTSNRESKRHRLQLIAPLIESERVLFQRGGDYGKLFPQMTDMGFERNDDLADALSMLVRHAAADVEKPDGFMQMVTEDLEKWREDGAVSRVPEPPKPTISIADMLLAIRRGFGGQFL